MKFLRGSNMDNEMLQIIGKECKVFELQLTCECGGNFVAAVETTTSGKYIDEAYCVLYTCTKCHKSIYVADVYPKHVFRPYGEFIRFGELPVKR